MKTGVNVSPRIIVAPGQLDPSPNSFTYPTLVTIDPLEVKIISILLYEINNCPTLFCKLTIGHLILLLRKKMPYVSLFSVQKFLSYNFKLLSLLKCLYSMSRATYIHDPLTCHTVTSQHNINLT